jgi:putative addiction module killer protein
MEAQPREVLSYQREDSTVPFDEWLYSLRDGKARARIRARLERVSLGNLRDYKSVRAGVCELRIDYGSGYRIYFGQVGSSIVLLLCGRDKSSQDQDIRRAKGYWADYERRESTN